MKIWNHIINWIKHLFNPHCPQCYELELERRICPSCETLKQQIDILNRQNQLLLEKILKADIELAEESKDKEDLKPLNTFTPWYLKRQMLEAEERKKAELLEKNRLAEPESEEQKQIEELEKKVGL